MSWVTMRADMRARLMSCRGGVGVRLLSVCALLSPGYAWAAETSVIGGTGLNYTWNDNINVSPNNRISLSGWILDGFVKAQYATPRFRTSANLKLDFERYNSAGLDSDNPSLLKPDPSDYDSDNQNLQADIAYDWERHTLSLYGQYWRDSTLNTQFLDTGLGGEFASEGATRRVQSTLRPSWQWKLTERQTLDTSLQGQIVDYESDQFIDYDYASAQVSWTYILTERMSLQVVPSYSYYKNKAQLSVRSDTLGLQAGFLWAMTEKWQFDLLAGGTRVYTKYGEDGYYAFDPDTGQVIFVPIEDQDSNGFTGNSTLSFTEEYYGFSANVFSRVSPSGNGILQQYYQGQLTFYWKPLERLRFDMDGLVGTVNSTDDRIENGRDFGEAGFRLAYQFAEEWWLSGRYRFREQNYERSTLGSGHGNSVFVTVSYRLPKEIF